MIVGVVQCTSWSIVLSYCHGKKFELPIVAENNRKQLSEKTNNNPYKGQDIRLAITDN
jgi:hypothetical protein